VIANFVFFRGRITIILTSDSFGCKLRRWAVDDDLKAITTSGFVRHLENVEIPLFIFRYSYHTHYHTYSRNITSV